jgi:hypothetical protein
MHSYVPAPAPAATAAAYALRQQQWSALRQPQRAGTLLQQLVQHPQHEYRSSDDNSSVRISIAVVVGITTATACKTRTAAADIIRAGLPQQQ